MKKITTASALLATVFIFTFALTNVSFAASVPTPPVVSWSFNNESEVSAGLIRDTSGTHNAENTSGEWVADGYDSGAILLNLNKSFKVNNIPGFSGLSVSFRMKTDGSTSASEWLLLAGTHDFNFSYKNGTIGIGVISGSLEKSVGLDQSYHYYVVSYDGSNISLYKDGQVAGFGTANNNASVAGGFWTFGTSGNAPTTVNTVKLDELKIYDHVLSDAEISYENTNGQLCYADTWSCGEYPSCSADGTQVRTCSKTFDCPLVVTPSPAISQSCTPPAPSCQADTWSCGDWNSCSASGSQTRSCTKTFDCSSANTPSPSTSQSCTPPVVTPAPTPTPTPTPAPTPTPTTQPTCTEDIWSCGDYNSCSVAGTQSRSCTKTFDCPNVQTATPTTDKSCQPPTQPQPTQNIEQKQKSFTDSILEKINLKKAETPLVPAIIEKKEVKEQVTEKIQNSVVENVGAPQEIVTDQNVASSTSENEESIKPSVIERVIRWFLSLF